jgi:hypothetical protein
MRSLFGTVALIAIIVVGGYFAFKSVPVFHDFLVSAQPSG